MVFIEKGALVHPGLRGTNMVTKYELKEGSCVIPNKISHINDETLVKVVKLASYAIRKMRAIFSCILPILFYIYLIPHTYTSKFSVDNTLFPWLVVITHIWWLQVPR